MAARIKLKGRLDGSASWASVLDDGAVELEFFDYSPSAQSAFGNDVAWLYRIEPADVPRLCELLAERSGSAVAGDQAMLDAIQALFADTWIVRDWLKENAIPYSEKFDSWA